MCTVKFHFILTRKMSPLYEYKANQTYSIIAPREVHISESISNGDSGVSELTVTPLLRNLH